MRNENRAKRQREIETAAYELLEEKGYTGTSMLSVAKRAKASNETLYRWYGDKKGLFKSLVDSNASEVKRLLENGDTTSHSPEETLKILGPKLLSLLVGKKAVTLNRTAASDPTGELGQALSTSGRETIFPLITKVFSRLEAENPQSKARFSSVAETYLGLLVGDLQIRRVIGAIPELKQSEISERADNAHATILRLLTDQSQ
ncbi:MAG: TetR/AcrR family transcriptional regulator [Rhizobiaceae bacterium]